MNSSNSLLKSNTNNLFRFLNKISNFFRNRNKTSIINEKNPKDKCSYIDRESKNNNFRSNLSKDYNELQRLRRLRELYDHDENYINNISTEDLKKLSEMNKKEIYELDYQLKSYQQ